MRWGEKSTKGKKKHLFSSTGKPGEGGGKFLATNKIRGRGKRSVA